MDQAWSQWITVEEATACEPCRKRRSCTSVESDLHAPSLRGSGSSMSLSAASMSPRRCRNESDSSSTSLNSACSASESRVVRAARKATRSRRRSAGEKLLSPKNEAMLLKILEVNKLGNAEVLERIRVKEPEKEIKRTTSLSGIIKKLSFSTKRSSSK